MNDGTSPTPASREQAEQQDSSHFAANGDEATSLQPLLDALHCQCPACRHGVIHASDCAVHNEPAMPNGPCDCGVAGHYRKCGVYNFAGNGDCTCGYDDVLPRRAR